MDTKLKKFNDNILVRFLAFFMCVMLFTTVLISGMALVVSMSKTGRSFAMWGSKDYINSVELQQTFQNQSYHLKTLIGDYKSEENIKEGKLLIETEGAYGDALEQLYHSGYYDTDNETIRANAPKAGTRTVVTQGDTGEEYSYEGERNFNDSVSRKTFIEENAAPISKIRDIMIKDQLREFNKLKDQLDEFEGILYYATNGVDSIANVKGKVDKAEFKRQPAYMIYEGGKLTKEPEFQNDSGMNNYYSDMSIEDELFSQYNDDLKVYLAFDKNYIKEKQAAFEDVDELSRLLAITSAMAAGCIILFMYLMITTGRKDENGKRKLYTLDRIWTELQLTIIGSAAFGGIWVTAMFFSYRNELTSYQGAILTGLYFVIAAIGLWFILACVRLLKAHLFIKTSLIYKLWNLVIHRWCGRVWRTLKTVFNGSSLMKKTVLCTLAICLLSATVFLAPVVFIAIIVFAPKWVKKLEAIKTGVEEVKNGNLSYKIPVEGDGDLDKLAISINEISEASGVAVQNELKNQRMKTELISNVSHDLKTPLTSMVTYIDLLKTEGLDSENAPEYLRVLDEKTERLRHLTEDLFEAAKASSGAMPVHLEMVELLSLINQGLGEMDGRIQASGLDFIINADKEKYYVLADGQLLWRVVENLLGNVLKYALEKSRVYIDIKELKTKNEVTTSIITLEMKNISKNPLNINADELMERFKRGDESRTTEGSGLGLAIAKDLVKLQNGWFEVFIDGDLFKAQVMLTKYEGETSEEQQSEV